jgi:hypothetical protein
MHFIGCISQGVHELMIMNSSVFLQNEPLNIAVAQMSSPTCNTSSTIQTAHIQLDSGRDHESMT